MEVVLASPRGFCAGVDRAIEIVELALERFGPPVYVRHEIVHNRHVVESLRAKGAIFIEDPADAPEGALLVFSAHGVSPAVREAVLRARFEFALEHLEGLALHAVESFLQPQGFAVTMRLADAVWVGVDDGGPTRLQLGHTVGADCVTLNSHVSTAMDMRLSLKVE